MYLESLTKKILEEIGLTSIIEHNSISSSISSTICFTALESSVKTAKDVLKKYHIKNIDWCPHAVTFFNSSSDINNYITIFFPLDILTPQTKEIILNKNSFEEKAISLYRFNYCLPTVFLARYCRMKDDKWNKNNLLRLIPEQDSIDMFYEQTIKSPDMFHSDADLSLIYKEKNINIFDYWVQYAPMIFVILARILQATYPYALPNFHALPNFIEYKALALKSKLKLKKLNTHLFNDQLFGLELSKALKNENSAKYLKFLAELGMLQILIPELTDNIGCLQNPKYHTDDVFDHLIKSLEAGSRITKDHNLLLAALFHDIGKAATRKEIEC